MTFRIVISTCAVLAAVVGITRAQGLILDDSAYQAVPLSAPLMRGDYESLVPSVSLKQYAPTPRQQGDTGTCVGWAAAYAVRTIMEADQQHWTATDTITNNAFSAYFAYNQLAERSDTKCRKGTRIDDVLEVMKTVGSLPRNDFKDACGSLPTADQLSEAAEYRILEYKRLFDKDSPSKVQPVKKSLSERRPVVIGLQTPESFMKLSGASVWLAGLGSQESFGGHAVAVVGYDDAKYGGAFEVMNSWGKQWGIDGFVWIRYDDFQKYVQYAFELILKEAPKEQELALAGSAQLVLSSGRSVAFERTSGYYVSADSFPSGTQFRILITNEKPSYVYALASDLDGSTEPVFPASSGVSAYLGYAENHMAIPDENHFVQMDDDPGTDFLAFLFSKSEIDFQALLKDLDSRKGDFQTNLRKALKRLSLKRNDAHFLEENPGFTTPLSEGVVVLVLSIEHVPAD